MTLQEIKTAVESGKKVYYQNKTYEVIKDRKDQWLIHHPSNGHCIGLTWMDNTTMNGKEEEFFTEN